MAEVAERRTVDETLQLALDICLGVGAFWVMPTGAVEAVVSDTMPPDDGLRRIEHLARNTLSHPAATGRDLFWNAEVSTEADSADRSLACVVVPTWHDDAPSGFLGVVDTWLPEPDEDQRAALVALAAAMADGSPRAVDGRWRPTVGARLGPFAPAEARSALTEGSGPDPTDPPVTGGAVRPMTPPADRLGDGPGASPRAGDPGAVATDPGRGASVEDRLALEVLRHLPDAVVVTRWDGMIVHANERFGLMVGRSAEELAGTDVRTVLAQAPGGAPAVIGPAGREGRRGGVRRLAVWGPSGELVPVTAADARIERGGDGGADALGESYFVTLLRPAPSAEGCSAAARIDTVDLVGNLDDGILCLDGTGTVVLANRAADQFHGLPAGRSLVGSPLPDLTGLRTEDGQPLAPDAHPGLVAVRDAAGCTAQLVVGGEGDRQLLVTVMARPFPVDGHRGALVVLHDSTSEWLEQQRLTQYALYDPLTGLANRYLLLEELRRMLLLLARQGGAVALVYLDLDGFKRINDEFGHDMGDEVLAAVARRLRGAVRSDDVVARLGGDEFVIAHASTERLPDGDLVVSRLRKVLSAPFRVRSQAFDVGASIGWVSTDRGEEGPDALLAKADRAMYLQKRNRAARRGPA